MRRISILFAISLSLIAVQTSAQTVICCIGGNTNSGVTSVGVTVPAYMSATGTPVTSSGTIAIAFNSETSSLVFAAPCGSSGVPTWRVLCAGDIPSLDESKITGLTSDLAAAEKTGNKNAASGYAGLDSDGKLATSVLPSLAITDTYVVGSQAAMLALGADDAERGDVAIRSDQNKAYILAADDPSILGNWVLLPTPTDAVLSVNGQTGVVSLSAADIADAESTSNKNATNGYAGLSSGKIAGSQLPYGSTSSTAAEGNDSRLSNARTPTSHASTHAAAGSDPVTLSPSQIAGTAVVTADSRLSDARTPTSHASSHASAGSDPVTLAESQVTSLTTDLAATEKTTNKNAASGYAGLDGSSKLTGSQIPYGSSSNTAAQGNDSRLSDSRTPTAHHASHQNGGSDEIATATAGANAIPKAGAGGTLASGWLPNPSASTLGGVESLTCTNQFLQSISTAGVPSCASVAYSILTGIPTIPTIATTPNVLKGSNDGNAVATGFTEPVTGEFATAPGTPAVFSQANRSTDAAPAANLFGGGGAFAGASTNTSGGGTIVAAGMGRRLITVTSTTAGNIGGKTLTFTVNGGTGNNRPGVAAVTLTEATSPSFTCSGLSTTTCATNIATAINADVTLTTLMVATASSSTVQVQNKGVAGTMLITTNAGGLTLTQNRDGAVYLLTYDSTATPVETSVQIDPVNKQVLFNVGGSASAVQGANINVGSGGFFGNTGGGSSAAISPQSGGAVTIGQSGATAGPTSLILRADSNASTAARATATEQLTLSTSGTTTTTAGNLVAAHSSIVRVLYRITTTIATATAFTVSMTGGGAFCVEGSATTSQTTLTSGTTGYLVPCAGGATLSDWQSATATTLTVSTTGTPSAGVIRMTVVEDTFVAPTS
jgi:hypothetical protein